MAEGPPGRLIPPPDREGEALQAARRQAKERGAALAVPGRAQDPVLPGSAPVVGAIPAVDGATVCGGARRAVRPRPSRPGRPPAPPGAPAPAPRDPRGRGSTIDLRG